MENFALITVTLEQEIEEEDDRHDDVVEGTNLHIIFLYYHRR